MLMFYRLSLEKIRVLFKLEKNNGTLHEDQYTFFTLSRSFLLRMRNASNRKVVQKIKTQILYPTTFFF